MMCNPCFMDANQVGYVHELEWEDVKKILDDAASIKPRRQLSVQFSGGEPTLSPHFLDGDPLRARDRLLLRPVRDQRHPLRAGARTSRRRPREAGPALRVPPVRRRRQRAQPAPQGRQPLRRQARARSRTSTSTASTSRSSSTIVNGVNNDQVGDIVQFAIENIDKINARRRSSRSPSPGRDEDIDDETRKKQRYTLSHLAHDVKTQAGHRRADARLVSALGVGPASRT